MDIYWLYIKQGLEHITDINGYDHILFIISISCIYSLRNLKNLVYIVTSFTIGHCIALALSTANIVQIDSSLVEFLIPLTIIVTTFLSLYKINKVTNKMFHVEHNSKDLALVLGFGLIHGLGFSNYLRFILSKHESLFESMLCFNIGLEIGQLIILFVVLCLNSIIYKIGENYFKIWVNVLLVIVLIMSGHLTYQNIIQ